MVRSRLSVILATAVSAIALVGVTQEAQAGAVGFGTTQISDFTVSNSGGTLTEGTTVTTGGVSNTESATASLNGTPVVSTTLAIQPAVNQVCLGNCTQVETQPFALVTPTLNPATTSFAQAATNLSANAVINIGPVPAGANSNTAAQTQLLGNSVGQGNAANGVTAGFVLTLAGETGTSEDITGSFNALTQLFAQTDAQGTTGLGSSSFEVKITEQVAGVGTVVLFDWNPNGQCATTTTTNLSACGATGTDAVSVNDQGVNLNNQVSADFPNQIVPYMASGTGLTFVADLPEGVQLNFSITQTNIAQATSVARVPEPMSLALFGAGLLGLGIFSRKRRRRA